MGSIITEGGSSKINIKTRLVKAKRAFHKERFAYKYWISSEKNILEIICDLCNIQRASHCMDVEPGLYEQMTDI